MEKQKYYLVLATDYEMYRNSWLFKEKFEAEKFIRHFDHEKWGWYDDEFQLIEMDLIE